METIRLEKRNGKGKTNKNNTKKNKKNNRRERINGLRLWEERK